MSETIYLCDNITMTMPARPFGDPLVGRTDLYIIREPTGGKGQRMMKAIGCFHQIFAKEIVGRMAVVADRNVLMAGLNPTVQILLHDVTVGAGFGGVS